MESLHIAVCDDSRDEQQKLLDILSKCSIPSHADLFASGEDFLHAYKLGIYDLIFMDIYMDKLSGVDVVEAIRKIDEAVCIAFTTTSTEHTLQGYRLDVIKYIEKPVKSKPVEDLLKLASMKKANTPHLSLKKNGSDISIPLSRILYMEQDNHMVSFFLTGDETISVPGKLNDIEKSITGNSFLRCHKSYIVNLDFVKSLDRELLMFHMEGGGKPYISRENLSMAKKAYESYIFDKTREYFDE